MLKVENRRGANKMRTYGKFWLVVAGILIAAFTLVSHSGLSGLADLSQDKTTLGAAGFIVAVFILGGISMHGVVLRLLKDQNALDELMIYLAQRTQKDPLAFREVVLDVCHHPKQLLKGASRVGDALQLLATRHDLSQVHRVKTPINRSVYHEDFETRIDRDMERIDSFMVLYAFLGLLGFAGVIYLTFKGLPVPKTIDQVGEYNRHLLSGLGLTYLLTLLGIGATTLTLVTKHWVLHDASGEVFDRFRAATFSVIFPVLQGSLVESQKEDAHVAS